METLDTITNFMQVLPLVGTAGQPTADQFRAVRDAGFEQVINLAMSNSTVVLPDEAAVVAALGLDYQHIPVVWQNPTLDDLTQFFAAMDANSTRKVFVHCAMNYRVSSFIYLYRVLRLGADEEAARWDLLSIWEPDECWSAFIATALEAHRGSQNTAAI